MNEQRNQRSNQQQIHIPSLGNARHRHGPADLRSYLDQVARAVWLPGEPELVPIDNEPLPGGDCWFVVSAWNPAGAPTSLADNLARHTGMTERLLNDGVRFRETAVWAPDRRWAEEAVALDDAERAEILAQQVGAPAYVEYSGTRATVRRTGFPESCTHAIIQAPRQMACPILGSSRSDEECVPQGGPWVSASVVRAAYWAAHRSLLRGALGCTVCRGVDHHAGARFVGEVSAASRWGDPVGLPDDDSADRSGPR